MSSVARSRPRRAAFGELAVCDATLPLPPVEAVDRLPVVVLPSVALHLAALQARVAGQLAAALAATAPAAERERWLTASEAATWLKVPVRWVYAHREELGGVRAGRYVRFTDARVSAALKQRTESG